MELDKTKQYHVSLESCGDPWCDCYWLGLWEVDGAQVYYELEFNNWEDMLDEDYFLAMLCKVYGWTTEGYNIINLNEFLYDDVEYGYVNLLEKIFSTGTQKRWQNLWYRMGRESKDVDTLYFKLVEAYSEPHRAYHNLKHVISCLQEFDTVKELAEHPDEIEMAIWFHDAVYDTHAKDNEEKSVQWATKTLIAAGVTKESVGRISDLIMVTTHNAFPAESDTRLMVDVDLAVLGKLAEDYCEYERNIRREYGWVPRVVYDKARSAILKSFLERESIYQLDIFKSKYEMQARNNIEKAIQQIHATSPYKTNGVAH